MSDESEKPRDPRLDDPSLRPLLENKLPNWQPGQSGNPAGRPRGAKNKSTLIRKYLDAIVKGADGKGTPQPWDVDKAEGDMTAAEIIVLKQIEKAMAGDTTAAKELLDAGYGKNPDIVVGDPEKPVHMSHTHAQIELKGQALIDELKKRGLPTDILEE